MSRSIVLSNGELCVALDANGLVRDIYYPHVGLEDHVRGHYIHRVGVWIEGELSWLGEDGEWQITVGCEEEALASSIKAVHPRLQVELDFKDIVYNERPVFVRRVTITNTAERTREIKLYFGHQFEIYKAHGGDTAYFDPISHSIIHYKGQRVFLIGALLDGEPFSDYATGVANFAGHDGTHRDAEDGALSKNPIEHGPADSVIGVYGSYGPMQSRICYYSVAAAQSIHLAHELNIYIEKKTPEHLVESATDYWKAWMRANEWDFMGLAPEHIALFRRSLLYVRAHVDKGGGILASVDSDMLNYGLDTYSYVWPRDAAYAALALDAAGDTNVAKRLFEFCRSVMTDEGYLLHKYLPDGSLGSSWHPWIQNGQFQLPIQEDETALVVIALSQHYRQSHDLEFLEAMYGTLVEKAADFMVQYRDPETKLPQPSYDLWEEKRGASTFTAAATYGALSAAADLAKILGKTESERRYREAAGEMAGGIMAHLWDEKRGVFHKLLTRTGSGIAFDTTIDTSSAYGIFAFGVLPPDDEKLKRAFSNTLRAVTYGIPAGGLARYEGDNYARVDKQSAGNPWLVTTLWYAEYLTATARSEADLARVRDIFSWTAKHAAPSGVLGEQLNALTGAEISAAPLTWSHAGYVIAILKYLARAQALRPV